MRRRTRRSFTFIMLSVAAFALLSAPTHAQNLAVTQESHGAGFGYGDYRWDNFSAELDANFDSVSVINDMSDLDEMLQYDALMIQIRAYAGPGISGTEAANLAAFVDSGRRVLMFGDNPGGWGAWNQSILSVFGGNASNSEGNGTFSTVANYPPLTDNVTAVTGPNTGLAIGGISIFDGNLMTVWAGDGSDNALSMLDVNVFEDDRWDTADAAALAANTAVWLASGGSTGPTLTYTGPCPGPSSAAISGATSNSTVALLIANTTGSVVIPGGFTCAGTTLGLGASGLQLLQTGVSDANGDLTFAGPVPANFCGRFLQSVDVATCATSNVAQIQ